MWRFITQTLWFSFFPLLMGKKRLGETLRDKLILRNWSYCLFFSTALKAFSQTWGSVYSSVWVTQLNMKGHTLLLICWTQIIGPDKLFFLHSTGDTYTKRERLYTFHSPDIVTVVDRNKHSPSFSSCHFKTWTHLVEKPALTKKGPSAHKSLELPFSLFFLTIYKSFQSSYFVCWFVLALQDLVSLSWGINDWI